MQQNYKIQVGGLGVVHTGDNRKQAFAIYEDYLAQSKRGKGPVGGESVHLFQNDEVIREYSGIYDEVYR